jgi:Xaa-Pro aminopeptidase
MIIFVIINSTQKIHNMHRFILILLFCPFLILAQDGPTDLLPPTFHKSRREALRKLMPPKSVAVFFASPIRNRANDVDYIYHQDPDFYYLTGYTEPNAVFVLFSENQKDSLGKDFNELFYAQSRDPQREQWDGKRMGAEGVKTTLGIEQAFDHKEFKNKEIPFNQFSKVFFFDFKNDVRNTSDASDLFDLIETFKIKAGIPSNYNAAKEALYKQLREVTEDNYLLLAEGLFAKYGRNPGLRSDAFFQAFIKAGNGLEAIKVVKSIPILPENLDATSLNQFLGQLRMIKTPEELKLLRKAIDVSCIGQNEVMKAMHPNMSEMEIKGIHEFVYRKYGSEFEGYPSIVGSGHNACVLHYIENNRQTVSSDLVLLVLGAEYHGYTADITRTIPGDGTFSTEQAAIYDLVYQAQEAAFKICKPGTAIRETTRVSREIIDKGLAKLGIIKEGEQHPYFPHGVSHHIGLDVHDRSASPNLAENMVITVEPGIYIPANSPCDPKWWRIGVRIEDDILITKTGYELLSTKTPRKMQDIEKLMKEKSVLDTFILPDLNKQN